MASLIPADAVPGIVGTITGLAIGIWAVGQKIREMDHDSVKVRLAEETTDHAECRRACREIRSELDRLRSRPLVGPDPDPDVCGPGDPQRDLRDDPDQGGEPAE
jgi:hypothetical protein